MHRLWLWEIHFTLWLRAQLACVRAYILTHKIYTEVSQASSQPCYLWLVLMFSVPSHFIPSHPIPSHPSHLSHPISSHPSHPMSSCSSHLIPSHLIPSVSYHPVHPITSHPISYHPVHPIPSHPILSYFILSCPIHVQYSHDSLNWSLDTLTPGETLGLLQKIKSMAVQLREQWQWKQLFWTEQSGAFLLSSPLPQGEKDKEKR